MSSRTYLCVPCRWARRAAAAYLAKTNFRCAICHGALHELDWRWRIPPKADDAGWVELGIKVAQDEAARRAWRRRAFAARIAKLEAQIAGMERQRETERRNTRLKLLRREREETRRRYDA